jgi:hypothetical protein
VAQAFDYWLQAGRRALQLYSTVDASQAFSRGEQLIQFLPELSDEKINNLYSDWNEMAYESEDPDTIRRINNEMLRIGRERDSKFLIGCALDGLSDACLVENQLEEGLGYTNQAITYLEQSSDLNEHMEAYNLVSSYLEPGWNPCLFQDALSLGLPPQDADVLTAQAIPTPDLLHPDAERAVRIGLNHAQRSLPTSVR